MESKLAWETWSHMGLRKEKGTSLAAAGPNGLAHRPPKQDMGKTKQRAGPHRHKGATSAQHARRTNDQMNQMNEKTPSSRNWPTSGEATTWPRTARAKIETIANIMRPRQPCLIYQLQLPSACAVL